MWGLKLGNERHMRVLAQELRTDNITSELAMFSYPIKGGEELRAQPIVYVPNIVDKVISLLDDNERYIIIHTATCTCFKDHHLYMPHAWH